MKSSLTRWLPTIVLTLLSLVGSSGAGESSASGSETYLLEARMTQSEAAGRLAAFAFQLKNVGTKEMQGCVGPSWGWEFDGHGDEGAAEVIVSHNVFVFKLQPGEIYTWEESIHFQGGVPTGDRIRFYFDMYRRRCKGKILYRMRSEPSGTQLVDAPAIVESEE